MPCYDYKVEILRKITIVFTFHFVNWHTIKPCLRLRFSACTMSMLISNLRMTPNQSAALKALQRNPSSYQLGMTAREVSEEMGLAVKHKRRVAQYSLDDLVKRGYVAKREIKSEHGKRSFFRYRLVEPTQQSRRENNASQDKRQLAKSYVYFVQWENDRQHVKIGYSTNLSKRFSQFLTASPSRLLVVALLEVKGQETELAFHDKFEDYRVCGEWFVYRGELKRWITNLPMGALQDFEDALSSMPPRIILSPSLS
jgi:predicted transcriptional regulator